FTGYTTAELSMNYTRPVNAGSGTLISRGRLITAGRSLGLSECTIEDGHGRLVAHGTSRCVIFPPMGPPPTELPDFPVIELPTFTTPDPYLRPVAGEVLGQDVFDRMTGLEVMRALIGGDLPIPPVSHLTGLRPIAAGDGTCTFVLPASPWLCSPLGKIEGGAIALLADTAIATAVQTTVPARTTYATLDLKVNYLRPVEADGTDMTGVGVVIHRGRTIAVANAELTDGAGRPIAVATGTAMILPDRPWLPNAPVVPADESPAAG
ncbi:MAG TPA: PaaI family thioesterase, partial [Actinomycetota bacterium]|nr:PaaI family thioesterase [Actinomycetota bacterium]